jgi:hypothetical protein
VCLHCGVKHFIGTATRVKFHLSSFGGKGITPCQGVSPEVRAYWDHMVEEMEKKKAGTVSTSAYAQRQFLNLQHYRGHGVPSPAIPHVLHGSPGVPSQGSRGQGSPMIQANIVDIWNLKKSRDNAANLAIATHFHKHAIPPHQADDPSFHVMCAAIANAGINFPPPTGLMIGSDLRLECKDMVSSRLKVCVMLYVHVFELQSDTTFISQPWHICNSMYGLTLTCDGTEDICRRPLLNLMGVNPMGVSFIDCLDTTGHKKDAW